MAESTEPTTSDHSELGEFDIPITGAALLMAARSAIRASTVFGIVLVIAGIFAVIAPLFTGIATAVLVGMLMIIGGMAESAFAFQAPSFGKGIWPFLFGGLTVLVGIVMLAMPGQGLSALTFVLAAFFFLGGVTDIALGFKLRPEQGWGWSVFSGALAVLLGILIIAQWPFSGIWAVGIFVGLKLLSHGFVLIAMATAGRDGIAVYQNMRMETLEDLVRNGLEAMRETQVVLAAHTAMFIALDNELRKKVSVDDVDPDVRKFHDLIGEARREMERAADAGAETWDAAQKEADKAFSELRENADALVGKLQKELGLNPT